MKEQFFRKYNMFMLFLCKNGWKRAKYIKKHNIFYNIGNNCYYHPVRLPAEPHLIYFGDNVFVGTDVKLITHDMSNCVFNYAKSYENKLVPLVDKIVIGNNVFIGAGAIIMPGVEIEDNCIIAAGAVVTKKVLKNSVVAGVPAKKIGTYEEHLNKLINFNYLFKKSSYKVSNMTLWEKQIEFFWKEKN